MKPVLRVVASNEGGVAAARQSHKIDWRGLWAGKTGGYIRQAGRGTGIIAVGLLQTIRMVVYYIMLWLRLPVVFISYACSGIGLIGLGLAALLHPDHALLWKIGSLSFCAFMTVIFYDAVLSALAPKQKKEELTKQP